MTTLGLFITYLESDPMFFVSVVFTVMISITLHELAHGWMAMRLGDDTPVRLDRMTVNPLVHMGMWSLIALAVAGIAWGQMPIDASRMRGKFAEAKVALAGPVTNLLLGLAGLTALGLWQRFDVRFPLTPDADPVLLNSVTFLRTFGLINLLLCVFNLLPVPPLDGSHILANSWRGYANFIANPGNGGVLMIMFILAFMFGSVLFGPAIVFGEFYLMIISGH